MSHLKYRFSPLAIAQLDILWDYGYHQFGEQQADRYLDGLFSAIENIAENNLYQGLAPLRVPADEISDITSIPIRYIHNNKHYIYLRELPRHRGQRITGIVCILGDRMDTPQRLKENLSCTKSQF